MGMRTLYRTGEFGKRLYGGELVMVGGNDVKAIIDLDQQVLGGALLPPP
jgi:hypothetical protein